MAQFEKIEYVAITYTCEEGGKIYGNVYQEVEKGMSGTVVTAIANNGYRFTGWSDGVESAERQENGVTANISVVAQFEKIEIVFLVNSYKVREIPLVDLNGYVVEEIVGYKSNSVFIGWSSNSSDTLLEVDALKSLKYVFNAYGIVNTDDFILYGIFEEADNGSVPLNSKTIAHGLGGIDGVSYQNSKESFEFWYAQGQRFFEADITITTDGIYVVSHNWANFSYSDFSGMDLSTLITLLYQYNDVFLDLDILGICKGTISSEADILYEKFYKQLDAIVQQLDNSIYDRIILEILPNNTTNMFDLAKEYTNIKNFLYAEYYDSSLPINSKERLIEVCQFCNEVGIDYISIGTISKEYVDILHEYGIYVMVFTYNDPILMYNYFDMGVDCIFTDFIYI